MSMELLRFKRNLDAETGNEILKAETSFNLLSLDQRAGNVLDTLYTTGK